MNTSDPREINPYIGPDGMRKTLQLLKNLYESYTKKNYGYEDTNGLKYSGVIDNFGTEIFLEARKLLLDKPILNDIFSDNTFKFYFNMEYSELINSYDQQNMICALLKKDMLLSNMEYRIKFTNVSEIQIMRAPSGSINRMIRDLFYHTTTNPVLVIHDINNESVSDTEIQLILKDNSGKETDYYFANNLSTQDYIDTENSDLDNGLLITKPISDNMFEHPLIWICLNELRLYPEINFRGGNYRSNEDGTALIEVDDADAYTTGNLDHFGRPLLTFGTDYKETIRLYPYFYKDNYPTDDLTDDFHFWILSVWPKNGKFIPGDDEHNYSLDIGKMYYDYYSWDYYNSGKAPTHRRVLEFDSDYISLRLSKDWGTPFPVVWTIKTPSESDWDYTSEDNYRAEIHIHVYVLNNITGASSPNILNPAFNVTFKNEYLNPYELASINAVSGIHLESHTGYQENSIPKQETVIHALGQFDGLPLYFKNEPNKKIDLTRVVLYSIRDNLNDTHPYKIMQKQVAGLIVDSAIPKTVSNEVPTDMNLVIRYDLDSKEYETKDETNYADNSLSEVVYKDNDNFGNSQNITESIYNKFIYHGKRTFSLKFVSINTDTERGRVYLIDNDNITYENNALINDKPDRTLAKICDVPTSFVHLINIKGVAPTVIIDSEYIRSECAYTETDKDLILNKKLSTLVTYPIQYSVTDTINGGTKTISVDTFVFPNDVNLNSYLTQSYLFNTYYKTINFNTKLNLYNQKLLYSFDINNGGNNYSVDDTFKFVIGGLSLNGTVTGIDEGVATGVDIQIDEDCIIHSGNLNSRMDLYSTTTVTGSGTNLQIQLTINEAAWNSLQPVKNGLMDNLHTYKFDKYGNVWIWLYGEHNGTTQWYEGYQILGPEIKNYYYDNLNSIAKTYRTINNSFMYNTIKEFDGANVDLNSLYINSSVQEMVFDNNDVISYNQLLNYNFQDSYYVLVNSSVSSSKYNLFQFKYMDMSTWSKKTGYTMLPQYNQLNVSNYINKTSNIIYNYEATQPIPYIFNPTKSYMLKGNRISNDLFIISEKKQITFEDIFSTITTPNSIIDSNGFLNYNIYRYNENMLQLSAIAYRNQISSFNRNLLISKIKTDFGSDAYPLKFEGTTYAYTESMLREYMLINFIQKQGYIKDDINRIFRSKGEQVIDTTTTEHLPIGEQPSGTFIELSIENFESSVYLNGKDAEDKPAMIFRIDDTLTDIQSFRLYDNDDNDISAYSIIIYKNDIYSFNSKKKEWIQLNNQ